MGSRALAGWPTTVTDLIFFNETHGLKKKRKVKDLSENGLGGDKKKECYLLSFFQIE